MQPVTEFAGPGPLVLTEGRQVKRLAVADFPVPAEVVGKIRIPGSFSPRSPQHYCGRMARRSCSTWRSWPHATVVRDVQVLPGGWPPGSTQTAGYGTGLMAPTRPSFSSLMPALNSSVPVPPVLAVPNFSAHRSSIWMGR